MTSVNKVILLGNIGRDPELRTTNGGMTIVNLSVATNRRFKDKSGAVQKDVQWHRVVLFDRQAEIVEKYTRKGDSIYIEGRLRTREYKDRDGSERRVTEIVAESVQLCSGHDREGDGGRDEVRSDRRESPHQGSFEDVPF